MAACEICQGLGFRSLDDSKMRPESNVFGLDRVTHASGKVTWEGDCFHCHGTGDKPADHTPQQHGYWARLSPFGWQRKF